MALKKPIIKKVCNLLNFIFLMFFSEIFLFSSVKILISFFPKYPLQNGCTSREVIYLNINGIHIDMVLPADVLNHNFKDQLNALSHINFIAFGRGDCNFYLNIPQRANLTVPVAFRTLFPKSKSAVHVSFFSWKVDFWKSLFIYNHQQKIIMNYFVKTFKIDALERFTYLGFDGYNDCDSLYEANGSFTFFNSWNVWVKYALKLAEIRTAEWDPFDFGILHHNN